MLTAVLLGSGLGWLAVVYLFAAPDEPVPAPHPMAGSLLAIHGAGAYAALLAYALVGHAHLRTGWRASPMRGPGLWLSAAIILLAVTGLGFYYIAAESAIPILRWVHVAAGTLFPCLLVLHIARGRRI